MIETSKKRNGGGTNQHLSILNITALLVVFASLSSLPYNYYYQHVFYVAAHDENQKSLNDQLHKEILDELLCNGISEYIGIDRTTDYLILYPIGYDHTWFSLWGEIIIIHALEKLRMNHRNGIYSFVYYYPSPYF